MMTDLFSSLDGANKLSMWVLTLSLVLMLISGSLSQLTSFSGLVHSVKSMWHKKTTNKWNMFSLMLIYLFLTISMNNLIGLAPLTYSLTSDLMSVSILSLLMWGFLLISGIMKSPKKTLAHLAPSGAPLLLLPLLVLIETVSIIIRPLTLTVRLIANISAGHIVMSLLSETLTSTLGTFIFFGLVVVNMFYMLFEFFVALIQAYIFTLLISLYQVEHP